jgi:hypothetical protein
MEGLQLLFLLVFFFEQLLLLLNLEDLKREEFTHISAKRVVVSRPGPKDHRRGKDLGFSS